MTIVLVSPFTSCKSVRKRVNYKVISSSFLDLMNEKAGQKDRHRVGEKDRNSLGEDERHTFEQTDRHRVGE